jgi:lysine 6-dehydrogenase
MKVLILGLGNIGSIATKDLANSINSIQIAVADKSETRAKEIAEKIGKENVSWIQLDVTNPTELAAALKDFDLVMGFLPGKLGYHLTKACIEVEKI